MTQRVLRYLAGAFGLLFILIGLGLLFSPGRQALMFAVFPSGPAGMSTVRADLAGLFIGMGAFALAGAAMASDGVLMVPTSFLGVIATGFALPRFWAYRSPVAASRSTSNWSSCSRCPSYSARLRCSCALAKTRHCAAGSPSVCGSA